MSDVEALRALARFEAESRQSALPDDDRVARAKTFLETTQVYRADGSDDVEADQVIVGLLDYATERLRVNRGLLAQQRQSESAVESVTALRDVSDGVLLAEVKRRMSR